MATISTDVLAELMKQNPIVKDWGRKTNKQLKDSASQFKKGKDGAVTRVNKFGVAREEKKLKDSLTVRTGQTDGIADRVSFRFERHGVFVHKGVGRDHYMSGGMVVRKGGKPITRKPVDWFNSVIGISVPDLANRLAKVNTDAAVNAVRLRIN